VLLDVLGHALLERRRFHRGPPRGLGGGLGGGVGFGLGFGFGRRPDGLYLVQVDVPDVAVPRLHGPDLAERYFGPHRYQWLRSALTSSDLFMVDRPLMPISLAFLTKSCLLHSL